MVAMKRRNDKGFSLVETVMVVMIIIIILAIALPMINNALQAYTLRNAADHVAERISAVRALALAKNKNITFSFNNTTQNYGFDFTGTTGDGVPDVVDPDDPTINYNIESLPSGVNATFPGNAPIQVTFTSRGELPIGAAIQDIVLRSGSRQMTVTVNLRGRIYVH